METIKNNWKDKDATKHCIMCGAIVGNGTLHSHKNTNSAKFSQLPAEVLVGARELLKTKGSTEPGTTIKGAKILKDGSMGIVKNGIKFYLEDRINPKTGRNTRYWTYGAEKIGIIRSKVDNGYSFSQILK